MTSKPRIDLHVKLQPAGNGHLKATGERADGHGYPCSRELTCPHHRVLAFLSTERERSSERSDVARSVPPIGFATGA